MTEMELARRFCDKLAQDQQLDERHQLALWRSVCLLSDADPLTGKVNPPQPPPSPEEIEREVERWDGLS